MSTKNLARTVIEGGRAPRNRWDRRHSNACERVGERLVSAALVKPHDFEAFLYPEREKVYRGFRDKLSPAQRWLEGQVGRPWNKVRSELFALFDTRTTAGRHILFDHLLRDVDIGDRLRARHARFVVDRHGLLKRSAPRRRWSYALSERLPEPAGVLDAWLDGRGVGERGVRCYWFVPTDAGFFRQDRELSALEVTRWRSLPSGFRQKLAALLVPAAN